MFLLKRSASVFNGMQIRQILQVFLQMSAQTAAAPAAHPVRICCGSCCCLTSYGRINSFRAIPHNPKCRYGERGTADAKPKAQIILDAAKVSAASGGNSEPKQGQRSQSARGFCPRSTMRVPQPDIIEHFGNANAVPQPPERCLSRQAGIVRCCLRFLHGGMRASRPTAWLWANKQSFFHIVLYKYFTARGIWLAIFRLVRDIEDAVPYRQPKKLGSNS